ncbi:MAG: PIN domain-containing protein [candidate division KSB1 bacterium]|nr:PIN domain-containing protein [candidate division KSB1 bacterium]
MKTAYIDLNILWDMLIRRHEHAAAAAVFDACVQRSLKGAIGSHEIAALASRIQRQQVDVNNRQHITDTLLDHLSVLTAHESILRDALHSQIRDYKKAVTDELAFHAGVDLLVVRDLSGFEGSKNRVCAVREAVAVVEGWLSGS